MLRWLLNIVVCASMGGLYAQVGTPAVPHSHHGWKLTTHGTIRVLLVFVEVAYEDPAKGGPAGGNAEWPSGQLPVWKDEVFDPFPLPMPRGEVTRYYHDISLGRFQVLGDYIDTIITIHESEVGPHRNGHATGSMAAKAMNLHRSELRTKHGFSVADFDLWKRSAGEGMPKEPGPDDPHRFDHVMFISRNGALHPNTGSTDGSSPGRIYGYESDSQSRFGSGGGLPFEILKHEFNHLLLGGNNFHSGGGNAAGFKSFLNCVQGGWSMMGAASSSLLTCTAWDRDRLGWVPEGAQHRIRARDPGGREVDGDLDPMAGDTGVFILRDMVTTGDALRIRMPFIAEGRYPQWLWVENHQGHQRNGSPTDRFHWEWSDRCIAPIEPGLFMVMQIEREQKEGIGVYEGNADYLRPIPANGSWDFRLRGDTIRKACPFNGASIPFHMDDAAANPLTGNHEQELPVFDRNGDGLVQRGEHWVPGTRVRNGREEAQGVFFGRPEHAFRMNGKRKLGMGTNPSSANILTLVATGTRPSFGRDAPNVRTIHLNGISVELLAMNEKGDATVRVRNDDTLIDEDVRWCADTIVLSPLRGRDGNSLTLSPRCTLLLDRSGTPTRTHAPDTVNGEIWFSGVTRLFVEPGAHILVDERATLELERGSELYLRPGSHLRFGRKARLKIHDGSHILVHDMDQLKGAAKTFRKHRKAGRIAVHQGYVAQ